MHHSILENKQVTIMWFFFNKTILGTLETYVCPKTKSRVSFFLPTWKKKQNKTTTPCCQKLAIWFLIDSKFPVNRTPHTITSQIEGGGTSSHNGEGGTISYHLFLGCISFRTYRIKSFWSLCKSHPCEAYCNESRPPLITPWAIS